MAATDPATRGPLVDQRTQTTLDSQQRRQSEMFHFLLALTVVVLSFALAFMRPDIPPAQVLLPATGILAFYFGAKATNGHNGT